MLRVVVRLDPAALLAAATEDLFPAPAATTGAPWPTLPSWLVLRQGGLRDDLHRLAAQRGASGWFDAPICTFAELAARWLPRDVVPSPLSSEERLAMLSALAQREGAGVFDGHGSSDAWLPAIDRLIGELVSEGVTVDALAQAMAQRQSADDFEVRRDRALLAIYGAWHNTLARAARSDGRDRLVRLAAHINAHPDRFAQTLGARRDVRLVGLADLRGGWTGLLRALVASPALDAVTVFASHALEIPFVLPGDLSMHYDRDPGNVAAPVTLLEAPDVARETELVAVRVRELLDAGAAPSRIGVFYRGARPGVDAMASALGTLGVPVTARRRTALATTGPARAVRALLNAAASGWTRQSVMEIAEQPLLASGLAPDVLESAASWQVITSLDEWTDALASLLARCETRDARSTNSGSFRRATLPPTHRVRDTQVRWSTWVPTLRQLEDTRAVNEWFTWTTDVLLRDTWGVSAGLATAPGDDQNAWRVDVRARDMLVALAQDWQRALAAFGDAVATTDAEGFSARLSLLMAADVITPPETGFGVVVSEALAGAWRSFDHVFVCGLSAGTFPMRASVGPLWSDADRRSLREYGVPLDPPDAWRSREQELFRVLCAGASTTLTLAWPAMDSEGREVVRSSFVDDVAEQLFEAHGVIETQRNDDTLAALGVLTRVAPQQVITPNFPLLPRLHTDDTRAHAHRVAAIERDRAHEPSAYNGRIDDDAMQQRLAEKHGEHYVWSATQLETLAKCAWSWFSDRLLGLTEQQEASDAIEPSAMGTILHRALDHFFAEARRQRGEHAVYLRESDRTFVDAQLPRSLDHAWHETAADVWLGNPALHHVVRTELSTALAGYLNFEISFNEKSADNRTKSSKQIQTGAAEGELSFDRVELSGAGVRFRIHGQIDRVDTGVDARIEDAARYFAAIDYKSSKYSTPGAGSKKAWDDGVVLQVPLYAAVLQALRPGQTLARLEYRTLRSPEVVHQLQFVGVKSSKAKGAAIEIDDDAPKRLQNALDAAGTRVRAAREGVLPARPVPSCGCSPYCGARDICRIPGGPVEIGQ